MKNKIRHRVLPGRCPFGKRFIAPVLFGEDFAEAYITLKETAGDKIYSMELDELKRPSDLKGGTLKERYHIPEGYNKLLQKIEKARALLKNPENSSGNLKLSIPSDTEFSKIQSITNI